MIARKDCKLFVKSLGHRRRTQRDRDKRLSVVAVTPRDNSRKRAREGKRERNSVIINPPPTSSLMDLFCRTSTNRRVAANVIALSRCADRQSARIKKLGRCTVFYQVARGNINPYNSRDKSFRTRR